MKKQLYHIIKKLLTRQAAVLMYHRVATPRSDVWEIAVCPENFEAHLQVLKKSYRVLSLAELVHDVQNKSIKKNSVAITFDDGYVDNYEKARPLLEKYQLPATFFIASGYIDQGKEFWWDTLEQLFLFTPALPAVFSLPLNEQLLEFHLEEEAHLSPALVQKHQSWKACEEAPPTQRAQLFYKVWEQLKPLPLPQIEQKIFAIKEWAGEPATVDKAHCSMTLTQLQDLSRRLLFQIGAHTVSHPALAFHSPEVQQNELALNQSFLKTHTGQDIDLLAYPYGNYNEVTRQVATALQFKAAFTTEEKSIVKHSNLLSLARYQVKNWNGQHFEDHLKHWLR